MTSKNQIMTRFLLILAVSVVTFTMFGFFDALLFGLYLQTDMLQFFESRGFTMNNSDVIIGAFSSSSALLISHYIKEYSKTLFNEVFENPLIDITGIFLGTIFYIFSVQIYKKIAKII